MPLLFFWQGDNYRHDLDMGVGYHLNQGNPLLHRIGVGDSLWAFTRTAQGRYALAAELVVCAKTHNPLGYRYGRYRLWGDLSTSRYFRVEGQSDIEEVVRHLSVTADAAILGRSFQGPRAVRTLTLEDHLILSALARDLPAEPRARLLPEERLEAALALETPAAVEALLSHEEHGIAERRCEYLCIQAPSRSRLLAGQLQDLYEGRCQICRWNPRDAYGQSLCQAHHLQWLSRGGADELQNMTLVCPNHHSAIHRCDAPFDFEDLAFRFADHNEVLQLEHHLGS